MPPGHAPAAKRTEFVQFSPAEQMAATTEAIKKAMACVRSTTRTRRSRTG